jgi:hypothetical protein
VLLGKAAWSRLPAPSRPDGHPRNAGRVGAGITNEELKPGRRAEAAGCGHAARRAAVLAGHGRGFP